MKNILSILCTIIVAAVIIFTAYKFSTRLMYKFFYEEYVIETVDKYINYRVKNSCLNKNNSGDNVIVIGRQ